MANSSTPPTITAPPEMDPWGLNLGGDDGSIEDVSDEGISGGVETEQALAVAELGDELFNPVLGDSDHDVAENYGDQAY